MPATRPAAASTAAENTGMASDDPFTAPTPLPTAPRPNPLGRGPQPEATARTFNPLPADTAAAPTPRPPSPDKPVSAVPSVGDPFDDDATDGIDDATGSSASSEHDTGNDPAPGKTPASKPTSTDPARSVVASDGKRVPVPPRPQTPRWPGPSRDEDYTPADDPDFHDVTDLNAEIARTRARLYRVNRDVSIAHQAFIAAELAYDQAYRRALVGQSGGSAESRRATAELLCEDLETDKKVAAAVHDRMKRLATTVRADLDALANAGHNLRAGLDYATPR